MDEAEYWVIHQEIYAKALKGVTKLQVQGEPAKVWGPVRAIAEAAYQLSVAQHNNGIGPVDDQTKALVEYNAWLVANPYAEPPETDLYLALMASAGQAAPAGTPVTKILNPPTDIASEGTVRQDGNGIWYGWHWGRWHIYMGGNFYPIRATLVIPA